jgi:tetratricopeptide (TPR) repeat protein
MRGYLLRLGFALTLAMPIAPGAAFAADSGGSGTVNQCSNGKVWDNAQQKCVDKSSLNEHDSTYETGRQLAKSGRYGEAIVVLSSIADSSDPRVLNYLGYSHRMQGRIEVGLGYYEEALRVNPDFTLAREYMGEAYLQKGDLAAARLQLSEIEKRCGAACEEYVELKKRIDAYLKEI